MRYASLLILTLVLVYACSKDEDKDPEVTLTSSVVNVDLTAVPYSQLSDYNLFQGDMKDMAPQSDVLSYDLISHLFTDYAKKNRYVWMPNNTEAEYISDTEIVDFPVGTVIIKTFYYDNVLPDNVRRIMETRLLIRKETQWIFAEYIWNDEQNEAYLDTQGDFYPIEFIDDNGITRSVNYRLPSMDGGECLFCHKKDGLPIPIGPKPQNLNKDWNYEDGIMNQLEKWNEVGYLSSNTPASSEIETVVEWEDDSFPLEERVRSYIDINCGHCHAEGSHCDYRPMRFAYSETVTDDNLGICVDVQEPLVGAEAQTHIIAAGNSGRSMLYYRFNTDEESYRMPLLGRSVIHEEAAEMIEEWIDSLGPPCD
ncbi:MAG: hypothetical protein HKN45_07950 [Flavobacteriales bacterium]|nr:hypothetical protein [Flavobacteriales bacterium]